MAVIGMRDAVSAPEMSKRVQTLESLYRDRLMEWRTALTKSRENGSQDSRWYLADSIISFARKAQEAGLQIANLRQALIRDIPIPKSSLGYLIKFRERYDSPATLDQSVPWSFYRELLDFKSISKMKECETMIRNGRIKSAVQVRTMCIAANRSHA